MNSDSKDGPKRGWWHDWRNRAMVLVALLVPGSAGVGYTVAKVQDSHEQTMMLAADNRREDAQLNRLSAEVTNLAQDVGELELHVPGVWCVCKRLLNGTVTTIRIRLAEDCDAETIATAQRLLRGFSCGPSA